MTNIKIAKVLHISNANEEHVTLLIDGHTIDCFANSCPYAIEIGKTYNIELTIDLSDLYQIKKVSHTDHLIEKNGQGYGYFLCGPLRNDVFESFTDLDNDDIHYDYPELNEHFIKIEANRINANFL